ncbi:MAG: DNA-directed RNA polymerase subunit alpha [Candidatus Omnitrophica bacterium]|nr:DNA-directed RNA polymerase subunit alpha [Candidatus Omnitrophota bacterium]
MGIAWKDFEMPRKVECEDATYTPTYGKFIAEPFERGYGTTIGNSIRRLLLSSLEGAAVTSVKFDGVLHEFSTIQGVAEDTAEVVFNIKQLIIRSHSRSPKTLTLQARKKGPITGRDIVSDDTIEILNPDLHIAQLTKDTPFKAELEIGMGRGYVPAERNKKEGQPIGIVPIDSIFTPVKKVNFHVENTRVGQMTDYDRLILEIWTNGSVSPKDALLYASHIFQKHLEVFTSFGELPAEETPEGEGLMSPELVEKLRMPVSELELSVRSANCLREAKIKTIGQLVTKTDSEMLKYRNFGKKSLAEIGVILQTMGLALGMRVDKKQLNLEEEE